jgi:phosphoserine phosphatase RsbU/P
MISSLRSVSAFLVDLQRLDRPATREESARSVRAEVLLDAFLRNTSFAAGAVFLEDGDDSFRLAAADGCEAPEEIRCSAPVRLHHRESFEPVLAAALPDLSLLLPLGDGRDRIGFIALGGSDRDAPLSSDEASVLAAVSAIAGSIFEKHRMAHEVREGEFQLKYRLWELESLYDIGLSIASTLDLEELADAILMRTVSLLNARRSALFLNENGRFRLHRSFGDVDAGFFDRQSSAEMTSVFAAGSTIHSEDAAGGLFPGCRSFVALPIRNGEEILGVLAAADREQRDGSVGRFADNEIRLLGLFANQAAIALENANLHREALEKQAIQRELELAATIQLNILPRAVPAVAGFEIESFSRPARQLGGDYYFFAHDERQLTFCVADVAGKSVPAAILVSALHAALQLLVEEKRDLGDIATELNKHIHRWSSENKFITMLLATVDRGSSTLRYVNAGHNPGYVIVGGEVEPLPSHGLPIGILASARYSTQTHPFPPGSAVVAYSDGITEAEDAADEEFGYERLTRLLHENRDETLAHLRDTIVESVDTFTAGLAQRDDQTIVLARTHISPS